MRKDVRTQRTVSLILNLVFIIIVFFLFDTLMRFFYEETISFYDNGYTVISIVFISIFSMLNNLYGGFKIGEARLFDLFFSFTISSVFSLVIIYLQFSLIVRYLIDPISFSFVFAIMIIMGLFLIYFQHNFYFKQFNAKKTLCISNSDSTMLVAKLERYHSNNISTDTIVTYKEYLDDNIILTDYECVIIDDLTDDQKKLISETCYANNIILFRVPNIHEILINSARDTHFIDTPIFRENNFGPSQISKLIKRFFDILISLTVLLLTWPIMLVVIICIKVEDRGPVFYEQDRLTIYGNVFKVKKFRSMRVDAEKDGIAKFAEENDSRITKVGSVIRKYRLDELPQMLNILAGDMSFVGPRPERPEIASMVEETFPEFNYRLKVKAGLTGYAQVYGKYNTELKDKLLLDMLYIENYSLLLDIKIIVLTVKIIFMKDSTEGV